MTSGRVVYEENIFFLIVALIDYEMIEFPMDNHWGDDFFQVFYWIGKARRCKA